MTDLPEYLTTEDASPNEQAIRASIEAQVCPFCGRGPYKLLPLHTNLAHGVDRWALRDLAGLKTTDPVSSLDFRLGQSVISRQRGIPESMQGGLQSWRRANPDSVLANCRSAASLREDGKRKRWWLWLEENPCEAQAIRDAAASRGAACPIELRSRRYLAGMSLVEVAQSAGISFGHLSHFETGRKYASGSIVERLAHALGCSAGDLLGASPSPGGTS